MKHQEIIELLPWYVNATLSQPEREAVREHLASGCGECAREIETLAAMHQAVVALGDGAPEPSPFLLNRALAEIEDYERNRSQQKKPERSQSWLSVLRESWWPKTPAFARVALAAQLALLLVVGTVAVYQYNHPQIIYHPLTGPSGQTNGSLNGAKISVIFNEDATERQIRQTLEEVHGTIVEGPTAQGYYTVLLPVHPEQTAELEKILQTLRQKQRVVRFAAEKQ